MVRLTDCLDVTMAVGWDLKHQNKQKEPEVSCHIHDNCHLLSHLLMYFDSLYCE